MIHHEGHEVHEGGGEEEELNHKELKEHKGIERLVEKPLKAETAFQKRVRPHLKVGRWYKFNFGSRTMPRPVFGSEAPPLLFHCWHPTYCVHSYLLGWWEEDEDSEIAMWVNEEGQNLEDKWVIDRWMLFPGAPTDE